MLFFNFWKNFFCRVVIVNKQLEDETGNWKIAKTGKNRTTERFKILPPHFSDHLPTNSYRVSLSLEMNTSYLKLVMTLKLLMTFKTSNDRCFINFVLICKEDKEQTNMPTRVDVSQSLANCQNWFCQIKK